MAGIDVEKLADELAAGLLEYSDSVTEVVKKAVEDVSKSTASELKQTAPKRTGAYAKDWTSRKSYEDRRSKRKTVYNKDHYQITHLLEFGYAKRNGGRVPAKPHIKAAEETATQELEAAIRKGI